MTRLLYLRDATTLSVDVSLCNRCWTCLDVCPHAVLVRGDDAVRIDVRDACMECGACSRNCPTDAISVDAGVGCAAAIIGAALRGDGDCRCGEAMPGGGSSPSCC